MKGLKKIALATAIAAAPFASHAGMKALDDTAMGNVTGQAGVTIELQTKVSIGEFRYTDTDGYQTDPTKPIVDGFGNPYADAAEGGSFVVSGITLGGAGVAGGLTAKDAVAFKKFVEEGGNPVDFTPTQDSGLLDDLAINIDVAANGDAIIHIASLSTIDIDGDGTPDSPAPIDWGVTVDEIKLSSSAGAETTLISGMSGYGYLAKLDIAVRNQDTVETGQTAGTGLLNISTAFNVADMDFDVDFMGVGIRDLKVSGSLPVGGTGNATADAYLSKGYAYVDVNVYSGEAKAAGVNEALNIDVNDVYLDVSIGDILIGNDGTGTGGPNLSIGSVALNNVAITDTKLVVYGR
ncbi:DUF6160 family protein [Marinobacter sp. UBA3607]|jgi:hypothetical protein|uniref:DUF6160 family protein n=1 Tax=Marinobacter sp. UBA3607 TaxID=1946820 RepID=UPI00257A736D|nr:DUF6160 family protein [Marinobacter sp. UBA3607]|tara:strand:- start:2660 stop:3709 length:1050 start_codon:yes stop_codon:yes gene_type:complete